MKELTKVLAEQDNERVIADIVQDLFTRSEIETFLTRIEIAKLLKRGIGYREIEELTGASSATIAKVSERVKYGFRGYDYF